MISSIISRLVILVFGTLYPAYASYKAVRTKNLKEYVKWMMYWIVFALFTCTETFTDVFLSWFPFYYEVKIVIVLWLLSPATKGSSILYRKFVHPALCRREQEIDEYIAKAKDQGYHTVLNLGTKGVNYATTVIMQTAIKGGGGLVQQLRKSYSLSDLSECEPREERAPDEADDVLAEPRLIRRAIKSGFATRRSASESSRSPMYFPEVDVDVRGPRRVDEPDFSHIKSSEDISSGYSSAENSSSLTRTSSAGARSRRAARTAVTTITTIKRPLAAEDDDIVEELHDDNRFDNSNMPPLVQYSSPLYLSHTNPPFIYQYVGDQVKIIQVLGSYPLSNDFNTQNNNPDTRDQRETNDKTSVNKDNEFKTGTTENETNNANDKHIPVNLEIRDNEYGIESVYNTANTTKTDNPNPDSSDRDTCEIKNINNTDTIDDSDADIFDSCDKPESDESSFETPTSPLESDEGSFGTPYSTPKSIRKTTKGKYGKCKAPMPPSEKDLDEKEVESVISENTSNSSTIIEKDLTNVDVAGDINLTTEPKRNVKEPVTDTEISSTESGNALNADEIESEFKSASESSFVVNENDDKKRRISKSPAPKAMSAFGKMLQLPNKLAFWHRTDKQASANASDTSDASKKSSIDSLKDGHQSYTDVNKLEIGNEEDIINVKRCGETISKEIIEKSDELQKVIEAKIESNPEYKYIPLYEDVPLISKSTDV